MALVVPAVGENKLMELALKSENFTLRLYVNDITPSSSDTKSTYTEMSTNGYAAKTLTAASWTVAQETGEAEGAYALQRFDFTSSGGSNTVYGYFVVANDTTTLLWSERFTDPIVIAANGDFIAITPKITGASVN